MGVSDIVGSIVGAVGPIVGTGVPIVEKGAEVGAADEGANEGEPLGYFLLLSTTLTMVKFLHR